MVFRVEKRPFRHSYFIALLSIQLSCFKPAFFKQLYTVENLSYVMQICESHLREV